MIFVDKDKCVMVNLDNITVIQKKSYAYKVFATDGDMHDISLIKGEELMDYIQYETRKGKQ